MNALAVLSHRPTWPSWPQTSAAISLCWLRATSLTVGAHSLQFESEQTGVLERELQADGSTFDQAQLLGPCHGGGQ